MKDLKDMTPIELNHLVNKVKENHDLIKSKIKNKLSQVEKLEGEINIEIEKLSKLEEQYVEMMALLIEKK
jgi:sensor domain CHASE-containing protein